MGYYINVPGTTKEKWLDDYGTPISLEHVRVHKAGEDDRFVVCLVDNAWMTAAGIAYDDRERDVFTHDDGRPKQWFLVKREHLKPFCKVL